MKYPKRLSSGKYVDLGNLKREDIDLNDINTSLNGILRFTGHYKNVKPLTVAQHTWLCHYLAELDVADPYIRLAVIIHDFPEYLTGDVTTQFKKMLGDSWKAIDEPIEEIIYLSLLGEQLYEEVTHPEVKEAMKYYDSMSLDIERRIMWADQRGKDLWPQPPIYDMTLADKERVFAKAMNKRFVDLKKMFLNTLKEVV